MSKLAEFRAAEKALQEQLSALEALKNDSGLQREIEFEEKLKSLMQEYDANLGKVIAILDPASVQRKSFTSLIAIASSASHVKSKSTRTHTPVRLSRPKVAITGS